MFLTSLMIKKVAVGLSTVAITSGMAYHLNDKDITELKREVAMLAKEINQITIEVQKTETLGSPARKESEIGKPVPMGNAKDSSPVGSADEITALIKQARDEALDKNESYEVVPIERTEEAN